LIPGAGTTSEPTDYQFIDESTTFVPGHTYWYSLESIVVSGESTIHEAISLEVPLENELPEEPDIPVKYGLLNNHPNPFNPFTRISFNLENDCLVNLKIYDIKGNLVRNLVTGQHNSGLYEYTWDGKDNTGKQMGSGIYLYNLEYGDKTSYKKMILIK
jgi:hypothetical protein